MNKTGLFGDSELETLWIMHRWKEKQSYRVGLLLVYYWLVGVLHLVCWTCVVFVWFIWFGLALLGLVFCLFSSILFGKGVQKNGRDLPESQYPLLTP